MSAHDVRDGVIGDRPGIKHIIRAGDDIPDPGFQIKSNPGLVEDALDTLPDHALEAQAPDIGLIFDLGNGTDGDSSAHKTSLKIFTTERTENTKVINRSKNLFPPKAMIEDHFACQRNFGSRLNQTFEVREK